MFKVPESYRIINHPTMGSNRSFGNNGAFKIPLEDVTAFVIASDGEGWEHVSVHIVNDGVDDIPIWEEMVNIKNMFWDDEDTVIQFHPKRSEYKNHNENVLHLWKQVGVDFQLPKIYLV